MPDVVTAVGRFSVDVYILWCILRFLSHEISLVTTISNCVYQKLC